MCTAHRVLPEAAPVNLPLRNLPLFRDAPMIPANQENRLAAELVFYAETSSQVVSMRFALLFLALLIAQSAAIAGEEGRSGHTEGRSVQQYQSKHFVLHTDLPKSKAAALLGRLEATLKFVSTYWQQPLRDPIECYVVDQLTNWPDNSLDPEGREKNRTRCWPYPRRLRAGEWRACPKPGEGLQRRQNRHGAP